MLQSVDHILNALVVADVVCVTVVDGGADSSDDDLFKVRPAGPHPISCYHETGQHVG